MSRQKVKNKIKSDNSEDIPGICAKIDLQGGGI